MIVTFPGAVTVDSLTVIPGPGGTASLSDAPAFIGSNEIPVSLTNVSDAQTLTITLHEVSDGTTSNDVTLRVSLLLGDTTANGSVNASDIALTKAQSGQAVSASNFRTDVNANGSINSSDISLVKSRSGTALP